MEQKEVEKILKGVQHSKADAIEKEDPDIFNLFVSSWQMKNMPLKLQKLKKSYAFRR